MLRLKCNSLLLVVAKSNASRLHEPSWQTRQFCCVMKRRPHSIGGVNNSYQQSLDEYQHRKIALVVAHDRATVQNVDRIYVFQNGHVAESARHEELLAANGLLDCFSPIPPSRKCMSLME